jgi:hypothetical protein
VLSNGPTGVSTYGLAFAPTDQRTGYACAGIPSGQPSAPPVVAAFAVTHDSGASWQELHTGPFAQAGCQEAYVDAADARDVFVTIPTVSQNSDQITERLYRSRDGGSSWAELANVDPADPTDVESLAVVGSRILVSIIHDGAGTLPYTLYSSDDGGATWQPIARAMTVNQYYAFGQLYAAGNVLYWSEPLDRTTRQKQLSRRDAVH